jgi:hypothetical protein
MIAHALRDERREGLSRYRIVARKRKPGPSSGGQNPRLAAAWLDQRDLDFEACRSERRFLVATAIRRKGARSKPVGSPNCVPRRALQTEALASSLSLSPASGQNGQQI